MFTPHALDAEMISSAKWVIVEQQRKQWSEQEPSHSHMNSRARVCTQPCGAAWQEWWGNRRAVVGCSPGFTPSFLAMSNRMSPCFTV